MERMLDECRGSGPARSSFHGPANNLLSSGRFSNPSTFKGAAVGIRVATVHGSGAWYGSAGRLWFDNAFAGDARRRGQMRGTCGATSPQCAANQRMPV